MLYKLQRKYLQAYLTFYHQCLPRIMKYSEPKGSLKLLEEIKNKIKEGEPSEVISKMYSTKTGLLLRGDK